jgi:hypothetical protein
VQKDLGPEGPWPLLTAPEATNVRALFALAAELSVRQGGIVCRHGEGGSQPVAEAPPHCLGPDAVTDRPLGCTPMLPFRVFHASEAASASLDRTRAVYVTSGCGRAPDGDASWAAAFAHITAGVRDAVVFGGGIEYALQEAVLALLRRRVRTHVVLDAAGTADAVRAQQVVAEWKRRGVDGSTVMTIRRMLLAG